MDKKMLQHNKLDSFFTEALMRNVPNWDMDTIRNAALICSNALLVNHGFSTTIQKYLTQKNDALVAYIEQE